MLIVHVFVHVKPDCVEPSKPPRWRTPATASRSRHCPLRRDPAGRRSDPFVLVEIYRTAAAPTQHKETAHYAAGAIRWRT